MKSFKPLLYLLPYLWPKDNRNFRVRFLIRGSKSMKLQNAIAKSVPKYKFSKGIKLSVDVDPINFN